MKVRLPTVDVPDSAREVLYGPAPSTGKARRAYVREWLAGVVDDEIERLSDEGEARRAPELPFTVNGEASPVPVGQQGSEDRPIAPATPTNETPAESKP